MCSFESGAGDLHVQKFSDALFSCKGDAGPFRQGAVGVNLMAFIDNWIIILERFDGSVNFNRNWVDYRDGFGNKEGGEFWLGNEKVHRLTNRGAYALRIEVGPYF